MAETMQEERLWHKSYAPGIKTSLEYEQVTVSQALTRAAQRYPGMIAMDFMGGKITYRELDALVDRYARALKGLGIGKGDKVAAILPNLPQTVIANLAAWRVGAVVVLVNPLYTERELTYILDDSDAVMAITMSLLIPRVKAVMPRTKVRYIVGCQVNDYLPFPKKQLFPHVKKDMYARIETGGGILSFMELMKKSSAGKVEDQSAWEELSTLIYTGGTTGTSKGVMLSHANISCNVQQWQAWIPDLKDGEDSIVGTFPIFHAAGFTSIQNHSIWRAWTHYVIPRPEPAAIIEALKKKPSVLPGVPTIFVALLADKGFRGMDLSFIKGFCSGAAPLPHDVIRELKQLTGADMIEVYGISETSPIVAGTPWGGVIKPGTVGIPVADTDVRIVDPEKGEQEMPQGEVGEIIIKGPQVMMGYYKKPEETRAAIRDGYFYSGDLGFLDEDGYLTIVDRKKDLIIAGGYNIYPVEIDNVLFDHPKILEACTIGVPDSYRGETPKAFIVLKEGETMTADEVVAYARERLAAYKVPRQIEFVDELPKSAVGKILRRELRDQELGKTGG